MFQPNAVIAQWQNAERTRGYMLQANGDLVGIERERPSDVWSPPALISKLQDAEGSFEHFLVRITRGA